MSVILAIVTATILIVIGLLRSRQSRHHVEQVLVKRYVHQGHTWARMTEDGDVLVGIDDFAQSLIGTIDDVRLPKLLRRVVQGEVGWHLVHGQRVVPLVSPVSGRVIEKNEMVLRNPTLINSSPQGDGWLLRIRPRRLSTQLHNLLSGRQVQQWQDMAKAQLSHIFSGTPALMYQDGGVLMKDLADRCSDAEWQKIMKEFFLVDEQ